MPIPSIGTSAAGVERPVLPPPARSQPVEVGELPAGRGGDEHLAGVRVAQRGLEGALRPSGYASRIVGVLVSVS